MKKLIAAAAFAMLALPAVAVAQEGTAAGVAGGAVAGAVVGGPVGAIIGAVAGAALGTAVDPPKTVRTYVVEQPVVPVTLQGDVVVGAGLPDTVQLYEVPDYKYSYAYINGQRVLVDPDTRRIVYVVQ